MASFTRKFRVHCANLISLYTFLKSGHKIKNAVISGLYDHDVVFRQIPRNSIIQFLTSFGKYPNSTVLDHNPLIWEWFDDIVSSIT